MMRWKRMRWRTIPGWLLAAGCAMGYAETMRQPLSAALVVEALHRRGIEVNAAKVHLPVVPGGLNASRTLEVLDADREAGGRLRVRMRCLDIADCMAFTAMLDVDDAAADAMLAALKPRAGVAGGVPPPQNGEAVLHAGNRLVLLMEQRHIELKVPCVAIDTGAVGETIRVVTLDRRKIFHAVVLGPMQARGVSE